MLCKHGGSNTSKWNIAIVVALMSAAEDENDGQWDNDDRCGSLCGHMVNTMPPSDYDQSCFHFIIVGRSVIGVNINTASFCYRLL